MSYDIYLKEPVTGAVAVVPEHLMIREIYKAGYHSERGTFTPVINTEAHLNVTYNYGQYYKDVYEKGIRQIYGMSGVDSIPILEHMISEIKNKYKRINEWINTKRTTEEMIEYKINEGDISDYWLATAANAIRPLYHLITLAKMRPDCIWDGD